MSFVDTALQSEFDRLLEEYKTALGNYRGVTKEAYKTFDRELPRLKDDSQNNLLDDIQKQIDFVTFDLYQARTNLFEFVITYADQLRFEGSVDHGYK